MMSTSCLDVKLLIKLPDRWRVGGGAQVSNCREKRVDKGMRRTARRVQVRVLLR